MIPVSETYWRKLFQASIVLKIINGIWETISGVTLLLISPQALQNVLFRVTRRELIEDPKDQLIHLVTTGLHHLSSSTKDFAGLYILAHGFVNIFLAYFLLRDRLWAYLVAIGFSGAVIFYLLYRVSHTHSLFLTGIIAFDICFIILTWHEYRFHSRRLPAKPT